MPNRDVEINLIGHDRTGHATRSAGRNLDQLARKIDKFNGKTLGDDKNKNKKGFDGGIGSAVKNVDKLDRKLKKKFVVRAGLDPQFVRDLKKIPNLIPNLFSKAGARARAEFKRRFGSLGLDSQFVRGIRKIPVFFSTAGARARVAFRRGLGSPGLDPQFVRDVQKIPIFFSRAGARARAIFSRAGSRAGGAFNSAIGRVVSKSTAGGKAGIAFLAKFVNAITFGQLDINTSFASALAPAFAKAGTTIGVVFAAKIITTAATAITAALPLLLGGLLLAGPIAFMLKQGSKASKDATQQQKGIIALQKRIDAAKNKTVKGKTAKANQAKDLASLQKELKLQQANLDRLHKQSQQWDRLKLTAKSFMMAISAPLQVPLEKSITAIARGLTALKQPLIDIFAQLGPALVPFTKGVMAGLLNFVNALKPSLPGLVAGFRQWGIELGNIGGALGRALAGILSDPTKVVAAVKSISGTIQGLIGFLGTLVSWLTTVDLAWSKWGSGFNVGTIVGKAAAVQTAILSMVIGIISAVQKVLPAIATMVSFMGRAFVGIIEGWNALPFTKNIDTGPLKAFTQAFETEVPKWVNALENYKNASKAEKLKVKLKADISEAEAKVKRLKAKYKTLPKEKRTEAKVEIAKAEALVRKLQGEINQLHGKQVDIWIRTHRATYYSTHGNKGHVPTNPKAGSGAPGGSSGLSWGPANGGGMLDGGGSRTGGPTQVNVAAPNVDTRVFLDSREIRAVARSTVLDENRRAAHRARVGRR